MNSIKFRIPTGHAFAFVEIDHQPEEDKQLSATQIAAMYDEYTRAFQFSGGLTRKEWNDCLDAYRQDKGMSSDCGERMNDFQRSIISEIDKSSARIKPKITRADQ